MIMETARIILLLEEIASGVLFAVQSVGSFHNNR